MLVIYPLFVENWACDWRRLWIIVWIASGTSEVHPWIVKKAPDIGSIPGYWR